MTAVAPPDERSPSRVHVQFPPALVDLIDQEARARFTCRSEVVRQLVIAQLAVVSPAGSG